MNTLKPLFIFAALGLVSWVVYSAISRSPDADRDPPHVEGLAIPSADAPLVQMPDHASLGSPFGATRPVAAQPPDAWAGPSHRPASSPGPGFRGDALPSVYPGESLYPTLAEDPPPGTLYASVPHPGATQAPPFESAGRREAPTYPHAPAAGTPDAPRCDSGCPLPPPLHQGGPGRGGADPPTWPSAEAAAGLAPPHAPSTAGFSREAPPSTGPSREGMGREPFGGSTPSHEENERAFQRLMDQVYGELDAGRLVEAHLLLSPIYRQPGLTPVQSRQVTELLDQLAGTVIYSRHSLLEPPYVVRPGDTLQSIAERFEIPPELIANINGIRDPRGPQPGQELKVVRGPFHAVVHLAEYEITMMLGKLYAGRFPITVGHDQPDLEGSYVVADKGVGPTYYGTDGATFDEHDPRNPLGNLWMGLGERPGQSSRIGIHGTNAPQSIGRETARGNVGLAQRDIEDVWGILSVGSRVMIQR